MQCYCSHAVVVCAQIESSGQGPAGLLLTGSIVCVLRQPCASVLCVESKTVCVELRVMVTNGHNVTTGLT
jgi:hypothetical protein